MQRPSLGERVECQLRGVDWWCRDVGPVQRPSAALTAVSERPTRNVLTSPVSGHSDSSNLSQCAIWRITTKRIVIGSSSHKCNWNRPSSISYYIRRYYSQNLTKIHRQLCPVILLPYKNTDATDSILTSLLHLTSEREKVLTRGRKTSRSAII